MMASIHYAIRGSGGHAPVIGICLESRFRWGCRARPRLHGNVAVASQGAIFAGSETRGGGIGGRTG